MRDLQLRQDILDELEFEPSLDAAHIGVSVDNGVITLTGHVSSYLEELAVVQAVRRVKGVRAIAQEIEVRLPKHMTMKDDEIAARAMDVLRWDTTVPSDSIQISVRDGWVALTGDVYWHYQRKAAEEDVRKLAGVVGVYNHIVINPQAPASYVAQQIKDALKRNAEVEAKAIRVTVQDGGKVLLRLRSGLAQPFGWRGTFLNWQLPGRRLGVGLSGQRISSCRDPVGGSVPALLFATGYLSALLERLSYFCRSANRIALVRSDTSFRTMAYSTELTLG